MNELENVKPEYIAWLKSESMLTKAKLLIQEVFKDHFILGSSSNPREDVIDKVSTWVSIYPNAVVTKDGASVLATLFELLKEPFPNNEKFPYCLGIKGIYLSPINRSGGVKEHLKYSPSTDGNFDPISLEIDPELGTEKEYEQFIDLAIEQDTPIIRNLIPLHTGQGPDFLLALLGVEEYRNIYMTVEIKPEHWEECLPALEDVSMSGADDPIPTARVTREQAAKLASLKYIPGLIHSADATPDAMDESGWSATGVIRGIPDENENENGKERRWVFMHYFKPSQPALNPDHPDCQALILINGIAINKIKWGRASGLRLDAIPFSIDGQPDTVDGQPETLEIWDCYTPSAVRKASQFASLIRQLGGFSFQELMAPLQEVKKFMEYGADLTYDFFTRTPYLHALLTGDAAMLRLSFKLLNEAKIQPNSLVHDLQNHDELTYQLPELEYRRYETFQIGGKTTKRGEELKEAILKEMREKVERESVTNWAPLYRQQRDGIATTMVGFIAAGLGYNNPYRLRDRDKERIKKAHLLAVWANAMQPGVFSLSAWDLVGALPLRRTQELNDRIGEGDLRWINRGGVDLRGVNRDAKKSNKNKGLLRSDTLYGTLTDQLNDPSSFASQLKKILNARERHNISHGKLKPPSPDPTHPGVCLLAMQLPEKQKMPGRLQLAVTALNFAREKAVEVLNFSDLFGEDINSVRSWRILDAVTDAPMGSVLRTGRMTIELEELTGKTILIQPR